MSDHRPEQICITDCGKKWPECTCRAGRQVVMMDAPEFERRMAEARKSAVDAFKGAGGAPAPVPPIQFTYTNWRGVTSRREVIPTRVWFGSTEWHPENGWMMTGYDVAKAEWRDFALKDCDFREHEEEAS